MFKFINAEITPKNASVVSAQNIWSNMTQFVTCEVFLDENWTFLT